MRSSYWVDTCCRLFCKKYKLPSFADAEVTMDHCFDEALIPLFNQISFPDYLKEFNPHFSQEKNYRIPPEKRGTMLQRNCLLLSRIFISNGKALGLADGFSDYKKIRILDIGCGNALNLLGILVYLGIDKVDYVGIDTDAERIRECKEAYKHLKNVVFKKQDACHFLKEKRYAESFDLILIQHPNIQSPLYRDIFTEIFLTANQALANNGIIYSTFYYEYEFDYFQKQVLNKLKLQALPGTSSHNRNRFDIPLTERWTGSVYVPENYTFMTVQKGRVAPEMSAVKLAKK